MAMKRTSEGPAKVAEDCCFQCKDGGDLRVCDFKNCIKAYHPHCVGKEDGFLSPHEQFICELHTCVNCNGSSDYQCLCCPIYSVCRECLGKVEFVKIGKQDKGFCSPCLNLAILIEKNNADPHQVNIGYRDSEIYEILFKDYWEVIKDTEHLTLVDLEEASAFLNRKLSCNEGEKSPNEDHKSDEEMRDDDDDSNDDANEQPVPSNSKGKYNQVNMSLKDKSKKKRFVGWGSEELIGFLSSLGKDTAKSFDEFEIVEFIKEYIREKNLFHGNKKKCFLCDDKLQPLFTRRKVKCKSIRKLLATHLAANVDSEDEIYYGSEDDSVLVMKKKPQNDMQWKIDKSVSERNKRCFASLNQNNIKLIYLRRTLVVSLLSHTDTFEQKVVGCFVRIKNCSKLHMNQMTKKSFQLGLVTGVKKSSEEYKIDDTCTNVLLCVTGLSYDVNISMLSEEDFEEDECHDLIPLVQKGLLKRANVAEFEEKVATVHRDIVNHWIEKRLVRLERQIEMAHIKGWHAQMEDLMIEKKLLSTPEESQRRLEEIPEIAPDIEDEEKGTGPEVAASNSSLESRGKKRDRASCFMEVEENSKGTKQQVANSSKDLEEAPPKGAAEDQVKSSIVLEGKTPEGDHVTDSSKEESLEGATEKVFDFSNVIEEETSKGAEEQIPDSVNLVDKESPEVASKLDDSTRELPSEVGEAPPDGVTPDPAFHSQLHNTQDDIKTQFMDTDEDENDHSGHSKGAIKRKETINLEKNSIILDSDEDEDLQVVQHKPEGKVSLAPGAMNDGDLHMQCSKSALPAQRAMDGVVHQKQNQPAHAATNGVVRAGQREPACAAMNESLRTFLWHYIDPQGDARGPFPLMHLLRWKRNGFFDEGFRVWRTGQTVDQAILLTDALRMVG